MQIQIVMRTPTLLLGWLQLKKKKVWHYQVLVWIQRNWYPYTLLAGLPNVTTIVENSLEVSYKVNRIQQLHVWVNKNLDLYKNLYTNFYSNFTYNSPAQMIFNWWTDKPWYFRAMEHCSIIKWNNLLKIKTGMTPKYILLSNRSQNPKVP